MHNMPKRMTRLARAIRAPAARNQVAGHPPAEQAARVGGDIGHPREEADLFQAESVNLVEIERQPGDVEPPHRVAAEAREHDRPGLAVAQQLEPGEASGGGRAILADEREFFGRDAGVAVGRVIEGQPQHQPEKAQRADREECGLPAVAQLQRDDQRRRHHRSDGRAAIEDGHAERALADRKPLGDHLGGARPVARFAEAQQEAEAVQAEQPGGEGVEHAGHATRRRSKC